MQKVYTNKDFCIKFSTNNRQIFSLVDNYLDFDGHGSPPKKRTIEIEIEVAPARGAKATPTLMYSPGVERGSLWEGSLCTPVANVRVDSKKRQIRATVSAYEESIKEHLLYFAFFRPIRVALLPQNLYCIHSAMIRYQDTGILICGPQNVGKSSLSYMLSQNGYDLLCDDDCFIGVEKGAPVIFPFPTKMGVRESLLQRYPEMKRRMVRDYRYGQKRRIPLTEFYGENLRVYKRRILLFPQYTERKCCVLRALSAEAALGKLLKENPNLNGKPRSVAAFSDVFLRYVALVHTSTCLELRYNPASWNALPLELSRMC